MDAPRTRRSRRRPSAETRLLIAALASTVVLVLGYATGLWLFVFTVLLAWLRIAGIVLRFRRRALPERLAALALDAEWRADDWDEEASVLAAMLDVARDRPAPIRRARGVVRTTTTDVGARTVALDRLDAALHRAHTRTVRRRRAYVRTLVVPSAYAVALGALALVLASDATPGPVVPQPWSSALAVVTAAVSGCALAVRRANTLDV